MIEAIEFAVRVNTSGVYGPWVPLRLTWHINQANSSIITSKFIRGYNVKAHRVSSHMVKQQVTICGEDLLPANASFVQFRWMNSDHNQQEKHDIWALFNVTASLIDSYGDTSALLNTGDPR